MSEIKEAFLDMVVAFWKLIKLLDTRIDEMDGEVKGDGHEETASGFDSQRAEG